MVRRRFRPIDWPIWLALLTAAPSLGAAEPAATASRGAPLLAYRRDAPRVQPQLPQPPAERKAPADVFRAQSTSPEVESSELETPSDDLIEAPTTAPAPTRRVAPPSAAAAQGNAARRQFPFALPAGRMLSTAGAGLAIVVGLLLACVWLLRRGGSSANSELPSDAFAVLGRAPLFGQTAAHLLRLGNKLVLVAATPDGVQPIVEVTDRDEVDRLTGICLASQSHSAAAEFQQVLKQLAEEPAKGFLGR